MSSKTVHLEGLRELWANEKNPTDAKTEALHEAFYIVYKDCIGGHLTKLAALIGEWRVSKQSKTAWQNVPEKLMLIVSEVAKAMDAYCRLDTETLRPVGHYKNFREEIANTIIRLLDLSNALGLDIENAICSEMSRNELGPSLLNKHC